MVLTEKVELQLINKNLSYQRIIVFIIQKLMNFSPKFSKLKMHSWDKTIC